jgi:hypothetical protein
MMDHYFSFHCRSGNLGRKIIVADAAENKPFANQSRLPIKCLRLTHEASLRASEFSLQAAEFPADIR